MIHMLSCFDLRPGEDLASLAQGYEVFLADLRSAKMIAGAGPPLRRVTHTPMDTDAGRTQKYFCVMYFRDRDQLDAAYAHFDADTCPGTASHLKMFRRLTNTVFLCWEDDDLEKD